MSFKDLREWLSRLREVGELWVIEEEVSPEPDIGAIGRAICDAEGPAALIRRVKGYTTPVAIGVHGSFRRIALALNKPKNSTHEELTEAWKHVFSKPPMKAKNQSDGPCKENVVRAHDIDLFKLPLHRINLNDGSFYVSKGCLISRDPETEIVNVGMYRMMVLDRDKTALMMNFGQHGAMHLMKQEEKGKPLEVAVAIGNDPILPVVAGAKIPYSSSEFDFVGSINGAPYELTQAESVDLPVPANSEIILEGLVQPERRVFEGTFGEFPGAYTGFFYAPVFQVTAITHRHDPIFESLYIGRPYTEVDYMTLHSKLAALFQDLKKSVPNITRIAYLKPRVHVVVIQGQWLHTGDPKQAITTLWGSSHGRQAKVVICVDEDVDPWNAEQVLWAISTRVSSPNDITIMTGMHVPLDPANVHGMSCKIGIDATKPRPPFYRYEPVSWVQPPRGTENWKDRMLRAMKDGGEL